MDLLRKVTLEGEVWKESGYDGYLVSNYGRIYSIQRVITKSNGITMTIGGKVLTQFVSHKGYLITRMARTTLAVHRLVAKAFVDNPNQLNEVNHIDGVKINNHVSNLEWVSHKENMIHASKTNLLNSKGMKGIDHPIAKLNESQVKEIRELHKNGKYGVTELGRRFGVTHSTIQRVVNRVCWKHI